MVDKSGQNKQAEGPLFIQVLKAKNFLRLNLVEFNLSPEGDLIEIIGENAQGKTSILRAIAAGLCGKRSIPENPIHDGQDSAEVFLDVGKYKITLTFVRIPGEIKGKDYVSELKVEDRDGVPKRSPQGLLNEMIGAISINPVKFIEKEPKDRIAEVAALIQLPIDLDQWEKDRVKKYDARREANVNARNLKGAVEENLFHENVPEKEIDLRMIVAELNKANTHNNQVDEEMRKLDGLENDVLNLSEDIQNTEAEIKLMNERLANMKSQQAETNLQYDKQGKLVKGLKKIDTAPINQRHDESIEINQKVRDNLTRATKVQEWKDAQAYHEELEKDYLDHIEVRRKALTETKMPVEGMTLAEESNDLLINGRSFDELSFSEQITVSLELAMSRNPLLRVCLIDEGSNYDKKSKRLIADKAIERKFQIFMAGVQYSDEQSGIVIEDGKVMKDNR